jgi:hypothetical protein
VRYRRQRLDQSLGLLRLCQRQSLRPSVRCRVRCLYLCLPHLRRLRGRSWRCRSGPWPELPRLTYLEARRLTQADSRRRLLNLRHFLQLCSAEPPRNRDQAALPLRRPACRCRCLWAICRLLGRVGAARCRPNRPARPRIDHALPCPEHRSLLNRRQCSLEVALPVR